MAGDWLIAQNGGGVTIATTYQFNLCKRVNLVNLGEKLPTWQSREGKLGVPV